jgi:hypothetical protein
MRKATERSIDKMMDIKNKVIKQEEERRIEKK